MVCEATERQQPNFIVTDDQGYPDLRGWLARFTSARQGGILA